MLACPPLSKGKTITTRKVNWLCCQNTGVKPEILITLAEKSTLIATISAKSLQSHNSTTLPPFRSGLDGFKLLRPQQKVYSPCKGNRAWTQGT